MRTTCVVVVLVAMASLARAEPPPKTYAQSMSEGARQLTANDVRAAAAAFQTAVDARPKDPRALSELSWANFLAGDLAGAERTASAAIYCADAAREPQLRAMAYYNLGRASEALGKTVAAQGAYAASLTLRDHREVRARLKGLAPALLSSHRLAGPFAKPEDFCRTACDVQRDADVTWDGATQLGGPFRGAAKIVAASDDADVGWPRVSVALELDDGWYVLPHLGAAARGHGGFHLVGIRMSGPRLIVSWSAEIGRFGHSGEHSMFVCGVGSSKQPSCVGPLVLEQSRYFDRCGKDINCTTRNTSSVWFHCRAELRGDVIEVVRDPSKLEVDDGDDVELPRPDACEALPISGKHVLTF